MYKIHEWKFSDKFFKLRKTDKVECQYLSVSEKRMKRNNFEVLPQVFLIYLCPLLQTVIQQFTWDENTFRIEDFFLVGLRHRTETNYVAKRCVRKGIDVLIKLFAALSTNRKEYVHALTALPRNGRFFLGHRTWTSVKESFAAVKEENIVNVQFESAPWKQVPLSWLT